MDKRIRKFVKISGMDIYGLGRDREKWEFSVDEFTKLIVLECAGLFPNVYVSIETDHGTTPVIAPEHIKKHFGIIE